MLLTLAIAAEWQTWLAAYVMLLAIGDAGVVGLAAVYAWGRVMAE